MQTERLTNLSAVAASLKKDAKLASSDEDEETFEMKYNRACYLLAQGQWEEAEKVRSTLAKFNISKKFSLRRLINLDTTTQSPKVLLEYDCKIESLSR